MKIDKVVSLFDGIACGLTALKRAGIEVSEYHAFEIDKYAMQIAKKNHPEIIHHGEISPDTDFAQFKGADLLIGGSPCQGFSFAGKELAFDDPRSALFFEYVRAKNDIKPKHFLLENVKMKKDYLDVITGLLDVEPILINSALVSAQNRKRYYWCNWDVRQPEDKGIVWGDIKEQGVDLEPMYYTDKAMEWIGRHGTSRGKKLKIHADDAKMQMIEASHAKKYSSQRFFGIVDTPSCIVGRKLNQEGKREDYNPGIKPTQCLEVRGSNKMNCLTSVLKDTVVSQLPKGRYPDVFKELERGKHYRFITPIEAERCQTLPDNYTKDASNSQRYKMIGNGWTVDVIKHLFKSLKESK